MEYFTIFFRTVCHIAHKLNYYDEYGTPFLYNLYTALSKRDIWIHDKEKTSGLKRDTISKNIAHVDKEIELYFGIKSEYILEARFGIFRKMIATYIEDKLFKPVALQMGFEKEIRSTGEKCLIYPKINWKK